MIPQPQFNKGSSTRPYQGQDDDETTFKNRTLRFTNNNFGGVTQASGFTSTNNQGFKIECAWGDQSQKNFHIGGNIMDQDQDNNDYCESIIEEEINVQ